MEKIEAIHPDPEKAGVRIDRWKYDVVKAAILKALPAREPGLPFKSLSGEVRSALSTEDLAMLGSVSWYTTTVKLDLEARGLVARIEGARPQRLIRTG
ncbi:MAG: hypothetical protein HKO65_16210 [Gemmatimonadetes bacterium]|nr:hypothetical protein [Gemmatimonadota bacterium]NNM06639.1 hypothetical protein [Gemmatimonadota bacterium]